MLAGARSLQTTFPKLRFYQLSIRFCQQKVPTENQKIVKERGEKLQLPIFLFQPETLEMISFLDALSLVFPASYLALPVIQYKVQSSCSIIVFPPPLGSLSYFLSFCPASLRVTYFSLFDLSALPIIQFPILNALALK